MNDEPALILLMTAIGLYVANLWRQDYLADHAGRPHAGALPGATPASVVACLIAAAGALIILTLETWGELRLGLSDEQSTLTLLFSGYTLIAAFIEELIFRGFIVVNHRGTFMRWAGVFAASLVFAALHPFLWEWEGGLPWNDGRLVLLLTAKGWFSTAAVFVSSLWFYAMRFASFNPRQSLLPCIVAHATKNLGVLVVKGVQGYIAGWY